MSTRPPRFERFHFKPTKAQIERIRALADEYETPVTEMTRRLINHALACSFFVPDNSSGRNLQPTEPTGK